MEPFARGRDILDRARPEHAVHHAPLRVVRDQRRRVPLVHLEPGLDGLRGVIGALFLGRAGAQAPDQLLLRYVEQQHVAQSLATLAESLVDELRLSGRAGEPVEDGAFLRLGLVELGLDQAEDDRIGYQLPLVHELLRLAAEVAARLDRGAEDVAGGDLGKPHALRQDLALRAFARAGRAEKEDEHAPLHVTLTPAELDPALLHEAVIVPQQQVRSEEHTSELQSRLHLVCRLLLEKKKKKKSKRETTTATSIY